MNCRCGHFCAENNTTPNRYPLQYYQPLILRLGLLISSLSRSQRSIFRKEKDSSLRQAKLSSLTTLKRYDVSWASSRPKNRNSFHTQLTGKDQPSWSYLTIRFGADWQRRSISTSPTSYSVNGAGSEVCPVNCPFWSMST